MRALTAGGQKQDKGSSLSSVPEWAGSEKAVQQKTGADDLQLIRTNGVVFACSLGASCLVQQPAWPTLASSPPATPYVCNKLTERTEEHEDEMHNNSRFRSESSHLSESESGKQLG